MARETIKCPHCECKVLLSEVEKEEGMCPECGQMLVASTLFNDFDDEIEDDMDMDDTEKDEEYDDEYEDDFDDEFDFDDDELTEEDFEDMGEDDDFDGDDIRPRIPRKGGRKKRQSYGDDE